MNLNMENCAVDELKLQKSPFDGFFWNKLNDIKPQNLLKPLPLEIMSSYIYHLPPDLIWEKC